MYINSYLHSTGIAGLLVIKIWPMNEYKEYLPFYLPLTVVFVYFNSDILEIFQYNYISKLSTY